MTVLNTHANARARYVKRSNLVRKANAIVSALVYEQLESLQICRKLLGYGLRGEESTITRRNSHFCLEYGVH